MIITKNENGYYEVRVKVPGGRYRSMSTHKKSRKEAEEMIRESKIAELELSAEIGVLNQEVASALLTGRRMMVEEALEPWRASLVRQNQSARSVDNAITWVRAWMAWGKLKNRMLSSITSNDFDAWVNRAGPQKLGTRKVMLSALRSFCRFCCDAGFMQGNPANLVEVSLDILPHKQKEVEKKPCFTEEEVKTLLTVTAWDGERPDPFWHAAIVIGRYTGLRLGDIACLEWDCLNFENSKICVWTRKRDRRVLLPMEPEILEQTLADLPRSHERFVFPAQREIAVDPIRRAVLSVQFRRLCQACQISGNSFHGLRATYITDCDSKGIPIAHISRRVGHANEETSRGYIRPYLGAAAAD